MRAVITGATGMVGGIALSLCLDHPDVEEVTVIGRRAPDMEHDKLRSIVHADFTDLSAVSDALADQDFVLFCIGVYTGAVPDAEFRKITVDYTVAFADALHAKSPDAAFCFLSGEGADPTGKSRMSFARYKGEAENHLSGLGFGRLHIFRPGYIYPVTPRKEPSFTYAAFRAIWPALRLVAPGLGIASDELAAAMVKAGVEGTDAAVSTLQNRDIRAFIGL